MKNSNIQWIGAIPDSWQLDRLQWHLDEIKESNNPVKTQQVLSLTNKLGVIPYEEKGEQGNKSKENIDEYKLAYPDTIVANSMNILIGSVGKCKYFGCVSPVYYVFKPKSGENIDFLNYVFQLTQFQKELRKYANGILEIRLRVSSNDILKRQIAFPSTEGQQRIVSLLDEKLTGIDRLIEIENQQIEKLKEYKQAVITEAVTKGLDKSAPMKDSGVEWIGEIPENWSTCRIKNVATISNGKEIEVDGGNIPVYGSGGIFKYTDKPLFSGISLLLGRKGTIDKPMLVSGDFWTVDTMFYTSSIRQIVPKYLFYCAKSLICFDFFKSGSVLPSMTQTELNDVYITYPNTCIQTEIADYLDKKCSEIDTLAKIKQKKIDMLNEYKKSLIYEYVTGKKEVV